jgi:hypothetical protein
MSETTARGFAPFDSRALRKVCAIACEVMNSVEFTAIRAFADTPALLALTGDASLVDGPTGFPQFLQNRAVTLSIVPQC